MMMEPEPTMMEPEPEAESMSEPVMESQELNEFKTVPGVQSPYVEEQEDDVLFGDAPETRTKKVGYN